MLETCVEIAVMVNVFVKIKVIFIFLDVEIFKNKLKRLFYWLFRVTFTWMATIF